MMLREVEIRKLPTGSLCRVVDILETNNDWKKVMACVPMNPRSDQFTPKYNNEHIRLIEDHAKSSGRKCAEILLEEWGTSGRVRPTLITLKEVVIKAEIFRAADEIAMMLNEPLPVRPQHGPAAAVEVNLTELLESNSLEMNLNQLQSIQDHDFDTTYYKSSEDMYKAIGNCSTKQIKSASDLIKFSNDINSMKPNISLSDKTTVQMKSDSNMIKFSDIQVPEINVEEPSFQSVDIPNFSVILPKLGNQLSQAVGTATQSDTESTASQYSAVAQESSTNIYQMSLPNIEFETSVSSGIDSSILQDTNLIQFDYMELEEITNKFAKKLTVTPRGLMGCIGSGGFGEVFVGVHHTHGPLAVKKAHNNFPIDRKPDLAMKVFNAEVKYLSQFRHNNIVPILGFSKDGPTMCIVCEFIDGGSLEQKIAEKVLSEKQRITIIMGTAEGLKYLHSSGEPIQSNDSLKTTESVTQNSKKNNFVHGDVKSANILLTKDCTPKLCDFGLAKQFDSTFITTSPMGTSAYMAPEGFSGTITQKIDIYSFGIVLLELLTGLRPIVVNDSEKINIKDYIEENCLNHDISKVLDPVVSDWKKANEIYYLSIKCLERQRKVRPTIEEICDILNKTVGN